MIEKIKKNNWITLLCICIVVYFFLQYISPLVAPVLVAMLFITICGPLLKRMQERVHLNRQVGVIFLLLTFGLFLVLLLWLLFTWILGNLPDWFQNMQGFWSGTETFVRGICNLGSSLLKVENDYLEELVLGHMQEGVIFLEEKVLPGILSGSMKYMKAILKIGAFLLLFVISTVFLAKDYDSIMNGLLDREECHIILEITCGIIRYVATFVKAQLLIMFLIGCTSALVLGVSGIPGGVFWGILAGFLDALPFLGTGIVLLPLTLVQLVNGHYVQVVVCILLYVGCIFIREWLEPKLIGRKMGIPPWVVLTAIYAGIKLFGVVGIIKGPLGFVLIQQAYLSLKKT